MIRIGVVTVARSDFNYLEPVLRALQAHPMFEPLLIVAAAHLSEAHGYTLDMIEARGFTAAARVPMTMPTDDPQAIAQSMARGTEGFAQAYESLKPDAVMLLGDRYETHAAAVAATPFRIPLIHLHGGEETEGAIDNVLRHSLTKLSHLHFTATVAYRQRVIQMGEQPGRVWVSGAPALDLVLSLPRAERAELERAVGRQLPDPFFVTTYHPVTVAPETAAQETHTLMDAIEAVGVPTIWTMPNTDPGGLAVREVLTTRTSALIIPVENLGAKLYYTALSLCTACVGNSSSGLLEAPSFGIPTVNIGPRQAGRIRSAHVTDVECDLDAITAALARALSPETKSSLNSVPNPYGNGQAAPQIVQTLAELDWSSLSVVKPFADATPH